MEIARSARKAANTLKILSNDKRTGALKAMHDKLRDSKDEILEANKKDLAAAEQQGLSSSLIKRLDLTRPGKFDVMLQGILDVAALEDPVNKQTLARHLDENLDLYRVSSPLGVLLVIFEARPEVVANIAALTIKSGNAVILKGGKESRYTFEVMARLLQQALAKTAVPSDAVQYVQTREKVAELLRADDYIDMVIPRGSNELVRSIKKSTNIPVLGHADGICTMYIDEGADPQMAARLAVDSKTNYAAACNAIETLLFHEKAVPTTFIPVLEALTDSGVTCKVHADLYEAARLGLPGDPKIVMASAEDFDTEFLSLTIAVGKVQSIAEAIEHINEHGSHHTDCIVTQNEASAEKFQRGVDSAGVYWNASTRFADGFRYGFGTEVGVSTNKLHARGPVGLEGIMSYQYLLKGHGQVVSDYVGSGGDRAYTHIDF